MKRLLLLLALLECDRIYSSDYGIPSSSYQFKCSYVLPDSITRHDNFTAATVFPAHCSVATAPLSSSHEHIFNRLEAEERKKAQLQQHAGSCRASYHEVNDQYVREQQLIEWASALTRHAGKCNEWTRAQYWNALRAAYCVLLFL
jgi:hypothetical protein